MKSFRILVLLLVIMLIGTCSLSLAATQTVTFEVQAINEIATSGNPAALVVNAAIAGSEPTAVSDAITTYAITTNETLKKITGAIDTIMPAGTTLTVNLAAPTAATSLGAVPLTAVAADLVTGISTVAESGKTITYNFSANVTAGVLVSATKTVTLTIL